jgi:hypothetical protein
MNSSGTTLDQTRPTLPVRLLNGCGALLNKSPIPRAPLRAVDVIETAKRRCGLDDFGGGDFFEGISRLVDSCQREAQLNLIGRIVLRADLIRILCSNVRTLPVQCRGVMVRPENVQKFAVRSLRWIELHFHDFGVPCFVSANIFVGGILVLPTGITGRCRQDSLQIAKSLIDTPKTARTKCCLLRAHQNKME